MAADGSIRGTERKRQNGEPPGSPFCFSEQKKVSFSRGGGSGDGALGAGDDAEAEQSVSRRGTRHLRDGLASEGVGRRSSVARRKLKALRRGERRLESQPQIDASSFPQSGERNLATAAPSLRQEAAQS